jgi:hypothetical protein
MPNKLTQLCMLPIFIQNEKYADIERIRKDINIRFPIKQMLLIPNLAMKYVQE